MKSYSCPDCIMLDNQNLDVCTMCSRNKNNTYYPSYPSVPNIITVPDYSKDYDPCENCSNHPKKGGSGMCHCTLPYLYGKYKITCSTTNT
jgi:hypothetical protein